MEKVYHMYHYYRLYFAAIVTVLILATPYPAASSFIDWRPFMVREDLALVIVARRTVWPPASAFDKYTSDNQDRSGALKGEDERREKKWGEFQFGSLRLRISRYSDPRLRSEAVEANKTVGIWDTMKSLPAQLGSLPPRETLETMGKLFTPELNLGIEF